MAALTEKFFNSKFYDLGSFMKYSQWQSEVDFINLIKTEPMFFNSDIKYSWDHGGPITRAFINNLSADWLTEVVFDSRVHMLMPGWYPAIPGYHHDDVPRADIPAGQHFMTAGQPDYDNPRYKSEHIMGLVNGNICPTHFAVGECSMPAVPEGELIYRKWHTEVEKLIENGTLEKVIVPSGRLIYFDWQTFHTGSKAISNGWRWFGRISRKTDRINKITNEIRRNAQVYLEFPMEGW